MQASVLQETLAKGIGIVGRAVDTRANLPVLTNVLLTADDQHVTLTATDLQTTVSVQIGAKVDKPGAITLPAKTLKELIPNLSPERVDIVVDDETQSARLRCGTTRTTIKGITASEFPPVPDAEGVGIMFNSGDLKKILRYVLPAVSSEDTRPVLTGVAFVFEGGCLRVAGADGFRLAVHDVEVAERWEKKTFVVPRKTIQMVIAALDDEGEAAIYFTDQRASFRFGAITVHSMLLEGSFPDFAAIIPRHWTTQATVYASDLLRAFKRAEIFSRDRSFSTRIQIDGDGDNTLSVDGYSNERGDAETVLDAQVNGQGVKVAVNARYALELLTVLESYRVTIEANGSANAVVIRAEGNPRFLYLIMPMSAAK